MLEQFKSVLYFPVASYFRYFAIIRLRSWNPKIVVITGSSGKTTLLHMLESQIGKEAKYSHHANSSFGIPFDILDLQRESLRKSEWLGLLLKAPLSVFKKLPKEKIYLIEADCDRPNEGTFLGTFLQPDIVLWLNVSRTHSMNFDKLVFEKKFTSVDEAIAYEYGNFLQYCSELAIVNGDDDLITKQCSRTKAKIEKITRDNLVKYAVSSKGTEFVIDDDTYIFDFLLPKDTVYAIKAAKVITNNLGIIFDSTFPDFTMPPGRSSLFKGIKNTIIVDSSYNANLSSMRVILDMFESLQSDNKWVILGDMIEQGKEEQEEHEKLAEIVEKMKLKKILLMGPRVSKFTYPRLQSVKNDSIVIEKFHTPKEVLEYITENITGGETLLFKGARFLEGVIEHLLDDKKDIAKLCRREAVWEARRKQWGL